MSRYNITGLNNLFKKLPWHELWQHFHPQRSARGLPPTFTWLMLLKSVVLQWKLQIVNDIDFAEYLSRNPDSVELCGMPRAPSHDVISKFTRKHGHKFYILHGWFDNMLEGFGVFDVDEIAGDGTSVKLHKPQLRPDENCFGAKSNKEKFYGLWLMLLVSVQTGLVRSFNFGKARIGQINLMFDLLTSRMIKPNSKIFLDGIFDNKDIHAAVWFDQESTPMITYNPKNSKCKTRKDLPQDDWRKEYNPFFKDGLWMILESYKRVSVERTNSNLKMNHMLKDIYERSRRLGKNSRKHIEKLIVGSIVMPQVEKLVEIHMPKPVTLFNFVDAPTKQSVEV